PSGVRRRLLRALISAIAGGGLTAAGLGPVAGGALAAENWTGSESEGAATTPVETTATETPTTTATTPTTTSTPTATTPAPTTSSTTTAAPAPAPAAETEVKAPSRRAAKGPAVVLQRRQKATGSKPSSSTTPTRAKAPGSAPAPANNNVAVPPQVIAAQEEALAAELAGSAASNQALSFYRIPLFLLPIYQAAAAQYGVPWQILAAINEIETDYGNDLSVSSAGAVGWMQFMPATWLQYGVDALNAGYADPYNPVDAIFAAARYLRAAGAPGDLNAAILAYNHSNAYLSSVLLRAKLISRYPNAVIAALTGLTDGRLPVRNNRVSWSATAPLISAPNPLAPSAHSDGRASTPATAPAPTAASALAPSPTGSAQPPSPGAASAAPPSPGAVAASRERPAPLQLVDLV